ncbi:MAG: type II secretion system protein [Oscillospiraceae bacterium]|nr:type II secretion system protein [Oscillospiraceae bacterium]
MKRLLKTLRGKGGMTLTEVMVGIAIIALVSMVMVTGFMSASALIRMGADVSGTGALAAKYIELGELPPQSGGSSEEVTDSETGKTVVVSQDNASSGIKVGDILIGGSFYRYQSKPSGESPESANNNTEYIIFEAD